MIKVVNLNKSFGNNPVLKDINITINKGEKVVVLGPSGSGKSTFLRCLNCMEDPTSGSIFFNGVDLADIKVDINIHRQKMVMVFQHFNLFPNMTIRKNISLAPVRTGLMTQEEADKTATRLLQRVGLEEKAEAYPSQLSGGQKQRIAIAGVLALKPRVMILDEATANIDTETEVLIQDSLEKMMNIGTMLMVAHRLSTIQHADKIIVLSQGKILEEGSHAELMKKDGIYSRMFTLQASSYKGEKEAEE